MSPRRLSETLRGTLPWIGLAGLAALVAASFALRSHALSGWVAAALAAGLLTWAAIVRLAPPVDRDPGPLDSPPPGPRRWPLALSVAGAALAWWRLPAEEFRLGGFCLWILALLLWTFAWWPPRTSRPPAGSGSLHPGILAAALVAILLVGVFFCFFRLSQVPLNPVSDHAEEMLDLRDLLRGHFSVFFFRNLGIAPLHFYWTAGVMKAAGLPLKYLTVKTATALFGTLLIPAVFLLGREVGGAWMGIATAALVAFAKWPASLARQGLEYVYAIPPTALVLWALFRYQRRGDRGSLLLAGLALGAGLYGYTSFRVVPLVVPLALGAALLDPRRKGRRLRVLGDGLVLSGTALLAFLPLAKFVLLGEHRTAFWSRAATRLLDVERPIPGSPLSIFGQNLLNMLGAFHRRGSSTWTVLLSDDPFLDPATGGLLLAGCVLTIALVLRGSWRWLWVVPAFFVLTLASTLSLAYPGENPSLNRAAPSLPLVFLVAALPLLWLGQRFASQPRALRALGFAALAGIGILSLRWNYKSYFVEFADSYDLLIEHSLDMAKVLQEYRAQGIPYSRAYLLGFDYWVDGRNIAFEIGDPDWADAHLLPARQMPTDLARPILFLYHTADVERLEKIALLCPGRRRMVHEKHKDRNFGVYVAR